MPQNMAKERGKKKKKNSMESRVFVQADSKAATPMGTSGCQGRDGVCGHQSNSPNHDGLRDGLFLPSNHLLSFDLSFFFFLFFPLSFLFSLFFSFPISSLYLFVFPLLFFRHFISLPRHFFPPNQHIRCSL